MGNSATRRWVPAFVFFLVLALLATVVWWRVLHRSSAAATPGPLPTVALTCDPGGPKIVLPKPSAVTVAVINGAGRDGVAAVVGNELRARGFKVSGLSTAAQSQTGFAEIRFGAASRSAATLLAYNFTGATLVPVPGSSPALTVTLGASFAVMATPAVAAAGLARYHKVC